MDGFGSMAAVMEEEETGSECEEEDGSSDSFCGPFEEVCLVFGVLPLLLLLLLLGKAL